MRRWRRWRRLRPTTAACWRAARAWCRSWRSGWRGPAHLVDINGVAALGRLATANGKLSIGACVRHAAFYEPVAEGPLGRLLATVVHHIGHHPIRTRGTFCGSLAHADPASEWCLVAATLGAEMVATSKRGTRTIAARISSPAS